MGAVALSVNAQVYLRKYKEFSMTGMMSGGREGSLVVAIISHHLDLILQSKSYYIHFTDKKSEAHKYSIICPLASKYSHKDSS